ncbi:hypothetical protein, partial [Escherichia coli]|uniref:hypothetical protein n=3 Tax=Escherichia coli TaxID=562 RepID=UPI001BDB8B96
LPQSLHFFLHITIAPSPRLIRNLFFTLKKQRREFNRQSGDDRSGYHRVPETVSCRRSPQGLCAFFTTWLFRMNHTEI